MHEVVLIGLLYRLLVHNAVAQC